MPYPSPHLRDAYVELRPWSLRDVNGIRKAVGDPTIPRMTTVPAGSCPTRAATASPHEPSLRTLRRAG